MIMVVFGAGASYDSVPSRTPSNFPRDGNTGLFWQQNVESRPPLAKELFLTVDPFADSLSRFPQCHPIVPYLQQDGVTIEHVLEDLQSEAESDPVRMRQLAAVRFYLQDVIWNCEDRWSVVHSGVTNYATLLDQLRRSRRPEESVCLVTFNYDSMIESALRPAGVPIDTIPQYIADDAFKLFKLHGSVNWAREVDTPVDNVSGRADWDISRELMEKADTLKVSARFRMVRLVRRTTSTIRPDQIIAKSEDGVPLFPAIAIPVETKRGYECPDDHLSCLQGYLPKIKKILLIGWRGMEQHFLRLLAESLPENTSACVVAGKKQDAEEVISRIQESGVRITATAAEGGFSDFVVRREAEKFLQS